MIVQLKGMAFGEKFINKIRAIYSKQMAKVIVNGVMTENFNIRVQDKDVLCPPLFILTLEVLIRRIRQDPEIKGMKIKKKLQAFADDLILILEEPLEMGSNLIKKKDDFGEVAGLKIKTKMLVKNLTNKQKNELMEKWAFR
uniref:Reverse transcriptase domain-containing protein n=1 Tax=Micrurus corallinus TaxID=54390 RepID=A0A2D4GJH5_MICCO